MSMVRLGPYLTLMGRDAEQEHHPERPPAGALDHLVAAGRGLAEPEPVVGDQRQHVQPDDGDPDGDRHPGEPAEKRDEVEDAQADRDAEQDDPYSA
jgi:hypothetical protein